jgi:hypothetical protein
MTTGNMLYLAMTIGVFVVLSAVLAYQSWQQSRLGPDMISQPAHHEDTHEAVTA